MTADNEHTHFTLRRDRARLAEEIDLLQCELQISGALLLLMEHYPDATTVGDAFDAFNRDLAAGTVPEGLLG